MAAASVEEAFAYCEARTKAHYENFPVGLFVPREKRPYVYALYAFARAADDFADEPIYEGVRREKLDQWEALTEAAYRGEAEGPIFVALAETVRRLGIPKELLLDLLSAFRQDTEKTRYASWDELLDYCRRSANPVGRLVLLVFEREGPRPARRSPTRSAPGCSSPTTGRTRRSTTRAGRIYVPEDLMRRHGVGTWDFSTGRVSDGWRGLMAELIARTRALFEAGRPLCDRVGRELRFEMRLTWLGGMSILDRIEATGGDVFRRRPKHGAARQGRRSPGAPGAGPRHERERRGAPHAAERHELLLRLPHPARGEAPRDLRALRLLPRGGRLRRRGGRRGRGGPRGAGSPSCTAPTPAGPRRSSAASWRRPSPASRSRAALLRGRRGRLPHGPHHAAATRPSPTCASTASAWPRRWASPRSRSSATTTRARASTRSSWASRSS